MDPQTSEAETPYLDSVNWQQLLDEARGGCDDSLELVFEHLRNYLLLIGNQQIGHRLQSKFGASDIFQMSLIEARDSIGDFTGSTEREVRTWLKRIMLHNLIDESRRYTQTQNRSLDREVELAQFESPLKDSEQAAPESAMIQRETDEKLKRFVSELPLRLRKVIELRHHFGFGLAEIAQQMQESEYRIRKLLSAAKTELRNRINEEE